MLNLILGEDWVANQNTILSLIADDVANERDGRILIVPELISHNAERKLCEAAGDTASRFAEVLSFTRLAKRVSDCVGAAAMDCLDDGGRIVAMAAAVQAVNSRLKAYASVGTKPEFLASLVDAVDEFKRCCIQAKDLSLASKATEGSLSQKLEELALIFESYDAVCLHGKKDPRDQMQWLLDELRDCNYAEERVFYVDGFPDFTRQNLAVLEHMIRVSQCVTVSLCCDQPGSNKLAFEKAGETAAELIKIARKLGVEVSIRTIPAGNTEFVPVCRKLFQGNFTEKSKNIKLVRAESVYEECLALVQNIQQLVGDPAKDVRYRDIGVACGNLSGYKNILQSVFLRSGIPMYISGTDSILEKPVISTVIAAIDTAMSGFDHKDVIRYLKTPCAPISYEDRDLLENYAITWGITGSAWTQEWTYHPFELAGEWNEKATSLLENVNSARRTAIAPLMHLRSGLQKADNIAQQVEILYAFFQEINLAARLAEMVREYDGEDNRNAQIFSQLWEILIGALEQMHSIVGACIWDPDVFSRLFRLLLSQYSVGTIPASLDCVTIGAVSTMRCQQEKHLFVLGAEEGKFPSFCGISGVLTDSERTELRTLGLPLTGGAMDGLQIEFSEIYSTLCGATESVTISCPAGQPSFVYERLKELAECPETVVNSEYVGITNATEAAAYFVRADRQDLANDLSLEKDYQTIKNKVTHTLGSISATTIEKLYGKKLRLSASKIDMQAKCRFSHWLCYGLGLQERKTLTIDPSEFGNYIHAVLEKTVEEVMGLGGFASVSLEDTVKIAKKHGKVYAETRFASFDTERLSYLFNRNNVELEKVVADLWEELRISKFLPKFVELTFDYNKEMPPINIGTDKMKAYLTGKVDRIDTWENGDKNYFRVVDYKSGKKSFDYCFITIGVGLQMLLYLYALEEKGQHLIGKDAIPAGVQYFPARSPILSLKKLPDDKTLTKARNGELKRKGLILADETVIQAMEPLADPLRMSYTRTNEGSLAGDVASSDEFNVLKDYVFGILKDIVNEIASGVIAPNPYFRGDRDNACGYCPYSKVCHKESVEDIRCYKEIDAIKFWETIKRKEESHG